MKRILQAAVLATGAVAATIAAAPAQAASALSVNGVVVVVSPNVGGPGFDVRSATLTCAPTGGTHVNRKDACGEISIAGGDLDKVNHGSDKMCIEIYRPIHVTFAGVINGQAVSYTHDFSNSCFFGVTAGSTWKI